MQAALWNRDQPSGTYMISLLPRLPRMPNATSATHGALKHAQIATTRHRKQGSAALTLSVPWCERVESVSALEIRDESLGQADRGPP